MFTPFWRENDKIIVAVSGGIDSMALAHLLVEKATKEQLVIVHVNHFMRKSASSDQQFVVSWAKSNGLVVETNQTAPKIENEEQARRFRYAFLKEIAQKYHAKYVVTAHHKDDNAETILMKLTRTGNAHTLLGIQHKRLFYEGCTLVRPLLHITKQALEYYVTQKNIVYRIDETNSSDQYTRNRFRHHIMPYLKQENDNVMNHIVNFADDVNQLNNFVEAYCDCVFGSCVINNEIDIAKLCQEQGIIQQKVLAKWLYQNHCLTKQNVVHLQRALQKQEGVKEYHLGSGKTCVKSYDTLSIVECNRQQREEFSGVSLNKDDTISINQDNQCWHITVCQLSDVKQCRADIIMPLMTNELPIHIRTKMAGDSIAIKNGHKKISRLFIDCKVPKNDRDYIPLIVTNQKKVIAILKSGLEYLSKYKETGKITHDSKYYVVVERENKNDS